MLRIIKYTICSLLVTLTAILFGYIALGKKPNFKNKRLYIGLLGSTILYIVFNYIQVGEIKSIMNFVMNTILFLYVYKISVSKSIFMAFIHALLLLIADICTIVIPLYIFKVDKNYLYNVFAGSILSNVVVCTFFIVLLVILRKPLQKLFAYEISSNIKIAIFSTLSIICVWIFFYIGFSNLENNNALLISVFGMVVFLTILFSLVKQKNR